MKKKILIIFGLCIIIGGWAYRHTHSSSVHQKITFVTVAKGDVAENVTATGLLMPRVTINLKSQIRGSVTTMYFDEGVYVKKGDKLLEVRPEPTPEEYARYKQTLALDQSKEQNQRRNLMRLQELWKKKLISSADYDSARQTYDEAVLERKLAEQNISLIEEGTALVGNKQIQNVLVSPIDGYILKRYVDVGDAVVPLSDAQAGTVLFTIAQMDDILFRGAVNEIDVGKINEGMEAHVQIGALPDLKLQGKVTNIALQSEGYDSAVSFKDEEQKQSRFRLEVIGLNIPKEVNIRAGFSATASIEIARVKSALVIPERLLHYDDDKVYVLKHQQDDTVAKQFVEVGISDGIQTEVKSGLNEHDEIQEVTK